MPKAQILVVDDTAIFRDPLAASLRSAGYDTACAANGEEAMVAITARRPDLILLDLAMPVMDGASVLRALRARGDANRIPVIVISATTEQQLAFEAGLLGADDYFVKSRVSLEEVIGRVGRILAAGVRPAPASAAPATGVHATPASPAPPEGRTSPLPSRAAHQSSPPAPDPRLVHLMCPRKTCGRVTSVEPELRGTTVACTHCGGALRVPAQKDGSKQTARVVGVRK